jgi:hypothetical protein
MIRFGIHALTDDVVSGAIDACASHIINKNLACFDIVHKKAPFDNLTEPNHDE